MISILHPSRNRPVKSFETIKKWISLAENSQDIEVIVSLDNDDYFLHEYKLFYKDKAKIITNDNESAIQAINLAASASRGNVLIVVSDDTDCFQGWDAQILKDSNGHKDWIMKTQDGIQSWIITMPIMDRAYYERFGYIYYPGYDHCFCDTELTCVADLTGRKIVSNWLFPHNHYSIGRSEKDQVSQKADATFEDGKALFIRRKKSNFDLGSKAIGKLPMNIYTMME